MGLVRTFSIPFSASLSPSQGAHRTALVLTCPSETQPVLPLIAVVMMGTCLDSQGVRHLEKYPFTLNSVLLAGGCE